MTEPDTDKVQVDDKAYHFAFKVSVIGDPGVGKTSLMQAQISGKSVRDPPDRGWVGITFEVQEFRKQGYTYRVIFWDSPGAERYQKLTSRLCAGAAAAVFVFDVNSRLTFEHLDDWVTDVTMNSVPQMLLVGNKIDKPGNLRQVMPHQAQSFAKKHGMTYFETSAAENTNVDQAFATLFNTVASGVPDPPEPSQLMKRGIKVGKWLTEDPEYRKALFGSGPKAKPKAQQSAVAEDDRDPGDIAAPQSPKA